MKFKNFLGRNFILILVVFVGVLASRDLFIPGYFPMHDDLQMMRQLEIDKCLRDWQIPCRWVPDMGYGYGYPLFNFYPPLPYLVGEVIKTVGFPFTATARMTFALSIILSGITMYLLAREFWGKIGGLISASFYVWAPYHAVDVYVRGAMNEAWALVWFPLILWASYKLIALGKRVVRVGGLPTARNAREHWREGEPATGPASRWIIFLSLSWAALLLTHNVMVLIFTPVFALWCFLWLWRENGWRQIPKLLISSLWALGLAAFFTIPILFEKNLVQLETLTQGFYEYFAHFVSVNQLFLSRFWGYGPSLWGPDDGMPFPIGHFHWVLALVIGGLGVLGWFGRRKINSNFLLITYYLLLTGLFAAFMAHSRSTPIWQALPLLSIVQFPWRFLTLVVFAFSFLAGAIILLLTGKQRHINFVAAVLVIGVIAWNFNFFRVERVGPVTDEEKFSGEAWRLQQTAGIYDYLPKTARIAPQSARKEAVEIVSGLGTIVNTEHGTNWLGTRVNVNSQEATVRVNILYFPNWRVFVDGREVETTTGEDELGRIHFLIDSGEHKIEARLFDTLPRILGNFVSVVSWIILLTLPWWRKRFSFARI